MMSVKFIELNENQYALVDADDFEWLSQWNWFYNPSNGYALRNGPVHGKSQTRMHREIFKAKPEERLDHINGDRLDNRKSNLRRCNAHQNAQNTARHSDGRSGYKGVSWHKKDRMWRARICVNYKSKFLGNFNCPKAAARCYDRAALSLFGEFARLNFPEEKT